MSGSFPKPEGRGQAKKKKGRGGGVSRGSPPQAQLSPNKLIPLTWSSLEASERSKSHSRRRWSRPWPPSCSGNHCGEGASARPPEPQNPPRPSPPSPSTHLLHHPRSEHLPEVQLHPGGWETPGIWGGGGIGGGEAETPSPQPKLGVRPPPLTCPGDRPCRGLCRRAPPPPPGPAPRAR